MTVKVEGSGVDVVVVGSVALDTIETITGRREELLGGSVSYACAAASFFARTGMVGIVGADFPEEHITLYGRFGIDLAGLQRVEGRTFRWSGVYEADMINRRTLATELNVFESFMPELPEAYRDAPFMLLGNISPELQLHVLSQSRGARFVLADTMDLWIETAAEPLREVIGNVNMLTLNDAEARLLTGEYNLKRAAMRLLEWGPEWIVIKKGEHGAMVFSENGIFLSPAYPVDDVLDPTGAGDSFAGGFLGALSRCESIDDATIRKCMLYGAVVASFGVQQFSLAAFESLCAADIDGRCDEIAAMMRL